jgi:hypothetical protein
MKSDMPMQILELASCLTLTAIFESLVSCDRILVWVCIGRPKNARKTIQNRERQMAPLFLLKIQLEAFDLNFVKPARILRAFW